MVARAVSHLTGTQREAVSDEAYLQARAAVAAVHTSHQGVCACCVSRGIAGGLLRRAAMEVAFAAQGHDADALQAVNDFTAWVVAECAEYRRFLREQAALLSSVQKES